MIMRKKYDELPKEIKECNINYCDTDDMISVTLFQRKYINQIIKMHEAHPDEVRIVSHENGVMVAHFPKKYLHISFGERVKREMTEEQRAAAAERLKKARVKKSEIDD